MTNGTEYVLLVPAQITVLPVMPVGMAGVVATVTAKVWGAEAPQELIADTVMLPLVADEVADIEIVLEVPDQPPGNVQT